MYLSTCMKYTRSIDRTAITLPLERLVPLESFGEGVFNARVERGLSVIDP
jgi:hypothetical protein